MQFEDLDVWRRAKNLCVAVYRELGSLKDFGFRDQITRSALSIPSNIAEGFERASQKECVVFLTYAKGSCGELWTQIYIGSDIGYVKNDVATQWIEETRAISNMIVALIKTKRSFTSK